MGLPLNGGAVPRPGVARRRRAPQLVSGAVAGLVEGMVSLWRVFNFFSFENVRLSKSLQKILGYIKRLVRKR